MPLINWFVLQELINTSVTTVLYLIAFIVQLSIFSPPYYYTIRGRNIAAGVSVHQTTLLMINVEQKAGISGHSKLITWCSFSELCMYVCVRARACVRMQLHMCAGEQLL